MGVADSPLRDRVVFVQGAPRSGTTWLVVLLATHPQIAGVEAESHLFEFGVDRLFDNFEGRDRHLRGLRTYLERDELVDLTRDLCDGVLMSMRSHIPEKAGADLVVEKTPTSFPQGALDLERKRECYPDAWYVHVVRDGDAVARSLMKAPFMHDRSLESCRGLWERCVGLTREVLSDLPRYREVNYEHMRADPAAAVGELFEWLEVDASEQTLATVRSLSRERFSELGAVPAPAPSDRSLLDHARPLARRARGLAGRIRRLELRMPSESAAPSPEEALGFRFVVAIRERDADALRKLTTDSMTLAYRAPEGDLLASGDEARAALLEIAELAFGQRQVSEWWAASPEGPREWWTRAPGRPFRTVFFSGVRGNATRIDLAFGITPEGGRVSSLVVVSAGSPAGRPVSELSLEALRHAD